MLSLEKWATLVKTTRNFKKWNCVLNKWIVQDKGSHSPQSLKYLLSSLLWKKKSANPWSGLENAEWYREIINCKVKCTGYWSRNPTEWLCVLRYFTTSLNPSCLVYKMTGWEKISGPQFWLYFRITCNAFKISKPESSPWPNENEIFGSKSPGTCNFKKKKKKRSLGNSETHRGLNPLD